MKLTSATGHPWFRARNNAAFDGFDKMGVLVIHALLLRHRLSSAVPAFSNSDATRGGAGREIPARRKKIRGQWLEGLFSEPRQSAVEY